MKSKIGIGYSQLSNIIYAGKAKEVGEGVMRFTGDREDITQEAIYAVVSLLKDIKKPVKTGEYTITYTIEEEEKK